MAANLAAVRGIGKPGLKIALVCKADAYGHGLVPVGRFAAANGADMLAVATVQEGVALRDAGVECPILVMSPILAVEADQAVFYGLEPFFENETMAKAFSDAAVKTGRKARLHLKVDTGLHRFGCRPSEARALHGFAASLPGVEVVGVGHHYVDSSTNVELATRQSALFESATSGLESMDAHQSNSAGLCQLGWTRGSVARIGIIAYGVDPFGLTKGAVRPILTWSARVTSVRKVPKGDTVSYNATWRAERDSTIATLGLGYGDGYPRNLSNKGFVVVRGHRAPVTGLVCMDQTCVDVTEAPSVEVGDTVEVVGANVPVPELARLTDTNSHEILTRIMSRVSRRYKYASS